MGFSRKDSLASSDSTSNANVIWHNVGIPCPNTALERALLEANYAAYYQSDTYNEISAVAADLGVSRPTLDPSSHEYVGNPMPKTPLASFSSASGARSLSIDTQNLQYSTPLSSRYDESQPEVSPLSRGTSTVPATPWPGKFDPRDSPSAWSSIPGACCHAQWKPRVCPQHEHLRSQSEPNIECCQGPDLPLRSKSDAGPTSEIPFDISTPWNPTFPPYSKYFTPPTKAIDIDEHADKGIGRPIAYGGNKHRLSELIDPADLLADLSDRSDSFSSASSYSYATRDDSTSWRSRSTSPATSASSSRKPSRTDSIKPLPPVLESPSGTLFSASEFAAHPNRPLAIRERQEHIRAAIESLGSQNRLARSASRKESADLQWKTGFGYNGRKGSKASISGAAGTAYGGFGNDWRSGGVKTLEEMKIEEGRRAYEEKAAKKVERSWGFSVFRGRKGS